MTVIFLNKNAVIPNMTSKKNEKNLKKIKTKKRATITSMLLISILSPMGLLSPYMFIFIKAKLEHKHGYITI